MLRKIALGALLLAGAGAAVVGVRTATFAPKGVAAADGVVLAPAPAIDVAAAAANLGAAIRFQTVSNQNAADNRVEEWAKLHAWLQSTYPAAHAAMAREVIAGATLVYHWRGSDPNAKPIILMAHQDVVPITPGTEKDWKQPPFDGRIAGNAVWGRGAIDDKGSLIALFEALELLAEQGFKPARSVCIVSGHDEEVGGAGALAASKLLASRGVKALFTLDEGSAIITDAPIVDGPVVLIGVAEKGYATLRLTANAKGGHSSMPPDQIGTVDLAKAVVAIHARQFPREIRPPVSDMLETLAAQKGGSTKMAAANRWLFGGRIIDGFSASPSGAAGLHTTIAPTMLQGSPKENVLPQSANALINYRIAPWNRSVDVMAAAREAIGALPIELAWDRPPREPTPVSSTQSQGWKLIRAAAEAEAPGAPVAPYLVLGGTDSRNFYGVSDDVYRFMPMKLSIKESAMIHGTNEHVTFESLERMIRFYARLIATATSRA
jgi:carboxypeptidase PM20D1